MKTPFAVQLDVDAASSLRTTATEVGATLSDLTALCVRYTLEKLPRERLRQWAQAQPSRVGRPPGTGAALTKVERAVLGAFDSLRQHGATVFSVVELARAAGVLVREAYAAVPALQGKGRVGMVGSTAIDRWGRPVELVAWLSGDAREVDQAQVLEGVVALRAELALLRVEPMAVELMAARLRKVCGWSAAALALPPGEFAETYDVSGPDAIAWLQARFPVAV